MATTQDDSRTQPLFRRYVAAERRQGFSNCEFRFTQNPEKPPREVTHLWRSSVVLYRLPDGVRTPDDPEADLPEGAEFESTLVDRLNQKSADRIATGYNMALIQHGITGVWATVATYVERF